MMAPSASVLLPKPLSNLDRSSIDNSTLWQGRFPHPWNYSLDWYFDGFGSDVDPEDLPRLAQVFGFYPADEIHVDARCSDRESHHMLGEFCTLLAERFGGIVNYYGALWPSYPGDEAVDVMEADWREIEPHVSPILAALPGRLIGLTYEPTEGRQWVSHYSDATFARAWLQNPHFHMIK